MKFFRSNIPILRLVLVLAAGGFLFPAEAQDDAGYSVPWLALQDFSAVEIPDEFNVGDKFKWGAKALFSHKDVKEIVPVFAYKREDICSGNPNQWPVAASAEPGALVLHVEGSNDEEAIATAFAVWIQSLTEACNLVVEDWGYVDLGDQSEKAKVLDINNLAPFFPLLTHLSNKDSTDFILTVGHLNVVDVDPTSEYWWRCRDDRPPTQNSVCRATLAASPYNQHKNLVR